MMMRRFRPVLTLAALAVVAAGCGTGTDVEPAPTVPTGGLTPIGAGVCAPDYPDCVDTVVAGGGDEPLFVDDEPRDVATPGASSGLVIPGGGLTVGEALATEASGVLAVSAFVFVDDAGARLCSHFSESLPPLCGGETIGLNGLDRIDTSLLEEAGGVQWTDEVVTLFGEIVDGVFVIDPLVSG